MRFFRLQSSKKSTGFPSFLDLLDESRPKPLLPDPRAISEFLTFGNYYGPSTPCMDITKEFTHQTLEINPDQTFSLSNTSRSLSLADSKKDAPVEQFDAYFESLSNMLKNHRVSIDMTGGYDSRLLACALKNAGVNFDAVYSDKSSPSELEIVKRVADKIGTTLKVIRPQPVNTDEHLNELFELSDGLVDALSINSLTQIQKWRKENGYTFVLTGAGGEVLKDFFWQQDFPFYGVEKANLNKLIDFRFYPQRASAIWVANGDTSSQSLQEAFIERHIKPVLRDTNTRTYDAVYYEVRIREILSALSHVSEKYLPVHSPFADYYFANMGYNLNVRERLFNKFHRSYLSHRNPDVAAIPTTDGNMTASIRFKHITVDSFKYVYTKGSSILRKARGVQSPSGTNDNSFITDKASESLISLKKRGVLSQYSPETSAGLPLTLHGRIITLALLYDRYS